MKIRLFLAALCLFLAPLCFTSSSQFSTYASGYMVEADGSIVSCDCQKDGCSGGDCGVTRPTSQPPVKDASLGSESLIVLAALMLWLRIRAN